MTKAEFDNACACRIDAWLPACGGTETPMTLMSGRRFLYCYNPRTGAHSYIDLDADLAVSYEEFERACGR